MSRGCKDGYGHTLVDPPEGMTLKVCTVCLRRIVECSYCLATHPAGPEFMDSDWSKGGTVEGGEVITRWYACGDCSKSRDRKRST